MFPEVNNLVTSGGRRAVLPYGTRFPPHPRRVTTWQPPGSGTGSSKGRDQDIVSNEPGRVALICRIVSLGPFTASIAFHLGAELIQRHGAESIGIRSRSILSGTHTVPLQHSHP
jgi:hypothetical protein